MNAQTHIVAAEQPFLIAFDALGDREALRLFRQLAYRFSYSTGHDKVLLGIEMIAMDAAEEQNWRGDDLAARYLSEPWPSHDLAPVIRLSAGSVVA